MKKLLLSLCFLLFSILLMAQRTDEERLAVQFYQDGEYEKAEELFSKIYNKKPDTYIYYYYYQTLLRLSNYKELEKVVKKQIKAQPSSQRFKIDLGYVYEVSNEQEKATKEYENAIKEVPANQNAIIELYNSFIAFNKRDYAIAVLQKGRRLLNSDKLFSVELTNIYIQQNQTNKVVEEALNLIKDNDAHFMPTSEQIIQNLLLDDENKMRYQSIKTQLQKQIQKNPSNSCYLRLLYWICELNKDYAEALALAKTMDKQEKGEGAAVYYLANTAAKNYDYNTAIEGYNYVIAKGEKSSFSTLAEYALLNVKYEKLLSVLPMRMVDALNLEREFKKKIEENGIHSGTSEWLRKYAHLLAFFVQKPNEAISLLKQAIQKSNDAKEQAIYKVNLADIQLFTGNIWEATLLYSQVDKAFPNDTVGQFAKFSNAKLSFYIGEFKWAKSQLDVLKAATSKLISNDAIYLSLLISENEEDEEDEDTLLFEGASSNLALLYYAKADFLIFQKKDNEALQMLDSVLIVSPLTSLTDDVYFQKAKINIRRGNYLEAESLLKKLLATYSFDILGDDATFLLAQLYDYYLKDVTQAMTCYQKVMKDYSNSILVNDARRRFRILRGDNPNQL
jgi:tetratricopeptide (TPR) repeat protein